MSLLYQDTHSSEDVTLSVTNSLLDWCVSSHLRQMEGQDRMNNIQVVDVAVADDSQDS